MSKIINYINFAIKHILNFILALLTAVVFLQVIFRFVLNQPLAWTEELAVYCLIWMTFLGSAYALSQKAHIAVDFFTSLFPLFVRKILYTLATLVSITFYIILVYQGYILTMHAMTELTPVLRLPMGWVYSVIPISGFLLLINLFHVFVKDMRGGGKTI